MSDLPPGLKPIDDALPPGLRPVKKPTKPPKPKPVPKAEDLSDDEIELRVRDIRAKLYGSALDRLSKNANGQDDYIITRANAEADAQMKRMGLPSSDEMQDTADFRSIGENLSKAERISTRFFDNSGETFGALVDMLPGEAKSAEPRRRLGRLAEVAAAESEGWDEGLASFTGYVADPVAIAAYGALKGATGLGTQTRTGAKIADEAILGAMVETPLALVRDDPDPKLSGILGAGGGALFSAAGPALGRVKETGHRWFSGTPGQLAEDTLIGKLRSSVRRNLTSAAGLPDDAFDSLIASKGAMDAELTEMSFQLRELNRAVKAEFGGFGNLTDDQVRLLDDALKGDAPPLAIPERLRPVITSMRNHVDALSRELIDVGAIEGDLIATVSGNMGEYLTRSYRVFDDPKWFSKVPPEVVNKAKALIRAERPDLGDAELDGLIDKLLRPQEDSPLALMVAGTKGQGNGIGLKDLSIITRRKNIPPELRALMGEYTDPRVNYARSVAKMSNLIANQRFLTEARQAGLGRFFFPKPVRADGISYSVRLADDGSKRIAPLDGLYTSKEVATAFNDLIAANAQPAWLQNYMRVNGMVKYSKTIGSLTTHIRNLVGNTGFAVANGHWRVGNGAKAFRVTRDKLLNSNKREWREYYKNLQRLGVVGESANAGELRDVLRDAVGEGWDELSGNMATRLSKRALKAAESAYQAEDDVWKIFAYENEIARYGKAFPDWTPEQLSSKAAEIVRNTYPTYSMVPRSVKGLRRWPLTGAFTSFPSEVVRVGYHTLKLAAQELRDPATRSIGAQRLVGIILAAGGTASMATASRFLTGTTADEEKDFRRFLPPWSANSDLIHLGRTEEGNLRYIDVGFVDPYTYLKQPAMALLRGDDWQQSLIESAIEAAAPFLGEEILLGKLLDVSRNKKPTGGRVFNPQSEPIDKWTDISEHLWEAIEPGTMSSIQRITSGLEGETNPYGKQYDPAVESLALFTGQRISNIDPRQALDFKARTFQRGIGDVSRIFNQVMTNRGEVGQDDLNRAYSRAEKSRRELFDEMHKDASAAIRLGVPEEEVRDILANANVSQRSIYAVITGDLPAFEPSPRAIEAAIGRARAVEDNDEAVELYQRRIRYLEQLNERRQDD